MKMNLPPERQTKIHFDPVPHKYYDDGGHVYTSVTTLIGAYKKPFNKKYWSMYVALRDNGFKVKPDMKNQAVITVNGIPRPIKDLYQNPINCVEVENVVDDWRRKTEAACDRGNRIHDSLENTINESKDDVDGRTNDVIRPNRSLSGELIVFKTTHDLEKTGIQLRYPLIYERLNKYIKQGCILYAEKRIYSTTYQIAGMIDVLIVKGKQFAILDWKTNKDMLMFSSGYYRKVKTANGKYVKGPNFVQTDDRLLSPIDYLQDCKGITYSLQLSLYATIMIRWGYKLVNNGLVICHIRPDMQPKFIPVQFLQQPIQDILYHHYSTRIVRNVTNLNNFGIN